MSRILQRAALVAALALLVAPTAAQAQGVGVGLKGGLLYSSFDFDGIDDVIDSKAGWQAGIFFGGNRPGTVGVMGEVNFLSKNGEEGGEDIKLYYVQVPVLLRVNFGSRDLDGVAGYVIAGPNFDIKIGDDAGDFSIVDEYEGFDVGLTAGAGVELSRFILEARGTWGFRNIAKDFMASDLKTRSFALLAGIRFN